MGVPGTTMLGASEPRLHPRAGGWLPWCCHGVARVGVPWEVGYPGGWCPMGWGTLGWGNGVLHEMGCPAMGYPREWGARGVRGWGALGVGCPGVGYPGDYASGPVPGTAPLRPRDCTPEAAGLPREGLPKDPAAPGRVSRPPTAPLPAPRSYRARRAGGQRRGLAFPVGALSPPRRAAAMFVVGAAGSGNKGMVLGEGPEAAARPGRRDGGAVGAGPRRGPLPALRLR